MFGWLRRLLAPAPRVCINPPPNYPPPPVATPAPMSTDDRRRADRLGLYGPNMRISGVGTRVGGRIGSTTLHGKLIGDPPLPDRCESRHVSSLLHHYPPQGYGHRCVLGKGHIGDHQGTKASRRHWA